MKKMKTSVAFALLSVSWQLSANTLDLSLACKGKFRVNNQHEVTSERGFVLKGKNIYFLGNEVPCDISPDRISCYKWNESMSNWKIDIDRVTGKLDYRFTNVTATIFEEFTGKCETVKRAI